ncbi:MAG: tRNA pseudouridine(38-40) synthase TruA [Bacillota bacterium]
MKTVKLTLGYLGERYSGWQLQSKQPHVKTVQGEVQNALRILTGEDIKITAAGRTDAGVHALGQVIGFATNSSIPYEKFPAALNGLLPEDIVVHRGEPAPTGFHARKHALGKWYRYSMYLHSFPHVFYNKVSLWIPYKLNIDAMKTCAKILEGTHDFSSFCAARSSVQDFVRTVKACRVSTKGKFLFIDIYADGFLYNMVRIIAGTLLEIGRGSMEPAHFKEVLQGKDRGLAGPTAQAKGLCLIRVDYEEEKLFCKATHLDMPLLFY